MPKRTTITTYIYERLKTLIMRRKFNESGFLPGEIPLSKEFGVSRPTLRISLKKLADDGLVNNRPGLGWELCENDLSKRDHFKPVAIILTYSSDDAQQMIDIIRVNSEENGLKIQIHLNLDFKRPLDAFLNPATLDGIIYITNTAVPERIIKESKKFDLPFISIGSDETTEYNIVTGDIKAASRLILKQLISTNHKNISVLTDNQDISIMRTNTLKELGKKNETTLNEIKIEENWVDSNTASQIIDSIKNNTLDSIICTKDFIASDVLIYLAKNDIQVPRDVSVITYDGKVNQPALTLHSLQSVQAIRFSSTGIAKATSELLIRVLNGETDITKETELIRPSFKVPDSVKER